MYRRKAKNYIWEGIQRNACTLAALFCILCTHSVSILCDEFLGFRRDDASPAGRSTYA